MEAVSLGTCPIKDFKKGKIKKPKKTHRKKSGQIFNARRM
jgi:hypothetical protein